MDTIKALLVKVFDWCMGIVLDMPEQAIDILDSHHIDFSFADSVAASILPIGISMMVLFFIIEFTAKCINPDWITYQNVTMFILKAMVFKQVLTYSSDLLERVYNITQNVFRSISSNVSSIDAVDAEEIKAYIMDIEGGIQGILLIIAFLMVIGITALVVFAALIYVRVIIYGIFIEILLHKALAPIALSTLVSETTSSTGKRFIQSYAAVCLQSSIIVLSSFLFSSLTSEIVAFNANVSEGTDWVSLLGFITVVLCYLLLVSKSGATAKSMLGL